MKKIILFFVLILVVSAMLFAACGSGKPNTNVSPSPIITASPMVTPNVSPSVSPVVSPNVSVSPSVSPKVSTLPGATSSATATK